MRKTLFCVEYATFLFQFIDSIFLQKAVQDFSCERSTNEDTTIGSNFFCRLFLIIKGRLAVKCKKGLTPTLNQILSFISYLRETIYALSNRFSIQFFSLFSYIFITIYLLFLYIDVQKVLLLSLLYISSNIFFFPMPLRSQFHVIVFI